MTHDSDAIERAALASLHDAASDELVATLGLRAEFYVRENYAPPKAGR